MIRFCNGLNRDLTNIVKLQHYIKLGHVIYGYKGGETT
jgi:hypothetical protein